MHFARSVPERRYRNYRTYRPLLRRDFQYRCAYCLTQELFLGGDTNFAIDHFRPRNGDYARPDLENDYANLYWVCSECNQNKADTGPPRRKKRRATPGLTRANRKATTNGTGKSPRTARLHGSLRPGNTRSNA